MRQKILAVAGLLFLAACSPEPATPATGSNSPSVSEAAQPAAVAGATTFAYSPLPPDVALATPFHVRSDRVYVTKSGATRRRSSIELLDGDATAAGAAIGEQLVQGGFRALAVKDKGDGVTRLAFQKKGVGRINVSSKADAGDKPANPAAKGLISLDWMVAAAPSKQAAASEAGSASAAE